MRFAIRSAPLAMTTGASICDLVPFQSTAKWVGFVTTTVALGTACIMRRRAHLALTALECRFRFGITFGLPVLVFDFLLTHLQRFFELPLLVRVVEQTDDDQEERELPRDRKDEIRRHCDDPRGRRLDRPP